MKPSSRKAKGRRLQNKIVKDLEPCLGKGKVRGRIMGESGEDIVDYTGHLPLSIEAKNQEKINIWDSMKQANANCSPTKIPAVIFTRNGETVLITMPWKDFLNRFLAPYLEEDMELIQQQMIEDYLK